MEDFGVSNINTRGSLPPGQMEWEDDADVAEENLEDFKQNHCYLRFAQVGR